MEDLMNLDLVLGEGEWRNMQGVVRKTFARLIEEVHRQQQVIDDLQQEMRTMQKKLASKPSREEMLQILHTEKSMDTQKHHKLGEFKQHIREQIADIIAEVRGKASIRYVDDTISQKTATFPTLNRQVNEISNESRVLRDQIAVYQNDISALTNRLNQLERNYVAPENIEKRANAHMIEQELADIRIEILDRPTLKNIQVMLDKKVSADSLEEIKMDAKYCKEVWNQLASRFNDLESILSGNLSISRPLKSSSKRDPKSLIEKVTELYNEKVHVEDRERMIIKRLGKVEDYIERNRDHDSNSLAMVLEEQRSRLDSVISGSIVIPSLHNSIERMTSNIDEISEYLSLPQPQTFHQQYHQLQTFMMDLDQKIERSSPEMKLFRNRMAVVEKSQTIVDSKINRLELLLNNLTEIKARDEDDRVVADIMKTRKIVKKLMGECSSLRSLATGHEVRVVALEESINRFT